MMSRNLKGLIYLALADPQEFFKQYLTGNEEQSSIGKRYSVHFSEESPMWLFKSAGLSHLSKTVSANLTSPYKRSTYDKEKSLIN